MGFNNTDGFDIHVSALFMAYIPMKLKKSQKIYEKSLFCY